MPAVITRAPAKKIDWKLASTLRAKGMTYEAVSQELGANGGDCIRKGLERRGVVAAIRTAVISDASQTVQAALQAVSDESKRNLAEVIVEQTRKAIKVKTGTSLKSIKRVAETLEPLARTAALVHGWKEQSNAVQLNVALLSSDLPMSSSGTIDEKHALPEPGSPANDQGQPLSEPGV